MRAGQVYPPALGVQNRALFRSPSSPAGRLFILFSRGEKEYKVVPRSVGEAVGRAWSAAVYASPCLASLPACQFACSLATWIPLRVPDAARLDSARLGSGAHRMVEENWKEAARSVAASRECDEDEGMREEGRDIPRKAPTSETLYRTVPHRATPAGGYEPVAAVAAVNRAGALNPRRPRRSRSRCVHRLQLRAYNSLETAR